MMNFRQALDAHFPGTISEADFVRSSYDALNVHGFNEENTIACVGVCRDEMTRSLVDSIQKTWGEAFNFSSLGGMLFLGKTGFFAAHHHAPVDGGRERYAYFAMAHIAIDEAGRIGVCHRPGRPGSSGACGALIAFRQEMLDGRLNLALDLDDIEQSLLKHRLFRKIRYGDLPDLVALTKIAYEVILEDLGHLVELTVDTAVSDYALLCGIQIHGPDKQLVVWPGAMYVVINGQRDELVLRDT
ncbi:MAG: hypothetical protein ACE5IY_15025 [bacterium]